MPMRKQICVCCAYENDVTFCNKIGENITSQMYADEPNAATPQDVCNYFVLLEKMRDIHFKNVYKNYDGPTSKVEL
jgi:hypothetical protein